MSTSERRLILYKKNNEKCIDRVYFSFESIEERAHDYRNRVYELLNQYQEYREHETLDLLDLVGQARIRVIPGTNRIVTDIDERLIRLLTTNDDRPRRRLDDIYEIFMIFIITSVAVIAIILFSIIMAFLLSIIIL